MCFNARKITNADLVGYRKKHIIKKQGRLTEKQDLVLNEWLYVMLSVLDWRGLCVCGIKMNCMAIKQFFKLEPTLSWTT